MMKKVGTELLMTNPPNVLTAKRNSQLNGSLTNTMQKNTLVNPGFVKFAIKRYKIKRLITDISIQVMVNLLLATNVIIKRIKHQK